MIKIFVSYSRKDVNFTKKLADSLTHSGFDVWIDLEDINAGSKWSDAIQQGLDETAVMLVIISPESMASENVKDEWQYFLDLKKPVIPILLRSAKIHFQLNRVQYIDFSTLSYNSAIKRLVEEIKLKSGVSVSIDYAASDVVLNNQPENKRVSGRKKQFTITLLATLVIMILAIAGAMLFQTTSDQLSSLPISTQANDEQTRVYPSDQTFLPSEYVIQVITDIAHLRNGPGVTYASVGTANKNDKFSVLAQAEGVVDSGETKPWYLVSRQDGSHAWIASPTVKLVEPEIQFGQAIPPPPPTLPGGGCGDGCG